MPSIWLTVHGEKAVFYRELVKAFVNLPLSETMALEADFS